MNYKVEFSKKSLQQLKKLDKCTVALIMGWVKKNLVNCENPRFHGKGLTTNRSGEWHYRVGTYRLLCKIQDEKILVLVLAIGHRSEIYSK